MTTKAQDSRGLSLEYSRNQPISEREIAMPIRFDNVLEAGW